MAVLSPAADIHHVDLDGAILPVAAHLQCHLLSHACALELVRQIRQPVHRLAVDPDDHIGQSPAARIRSLEARAIRGRARHGTHHGHAFCADAALVLPKASVPRMPSVAPKRAIRVRDGKATMRLR